MGEKGARLSDEATEAAAAIVDELEPLGDVRSKKMFGGHGLFGDGVMFAIVDSSGALFFRVGEENLPAYMEAGSAKHGKMPYYAVPADVTDDTDRLLAWAAEALRVAKAAKK